MLLLHAGHRDGGLTLPPLWQANCCIPCFHEQVMKTCTFYIVFVTVLINGGTAAELLEKLKLRACDVPSLLVNVECDTGGFGGGGRGGEEAEGGEGEGYQGRYLPWQLRATPGDSCVGDRSHLCLGVPLRGWRGPSG